MEKKRQDDFKEYVKNSGVHECLTDILVQLYEEPKQPENAIRFIYEQLGKKLESASARPDPGKRSEEPAVQPETEAETTLKAEDIELPTERLQEKITPQ
ncbi:uncharacterized protein LOC136031323 [Artemia franciscana]